MRGRQAQAAAADVHTWVWRIGKCSPEARRHASINPEQQQQRGSVRRMPFAARLRLQALAVRTSAMPPLGTSADRSPQGANSRTSTRKFSVRKTCRKGRAADTSDWQWGIPSKPHGSRALWGDLGTQRQPMPRNWGEATLEGGETCSTPRAGHWHGGQVVPLTVCKQPKPPPREA